MNPFLLFFGPIALLAFINFCWYRRASRKRRMRVRRVLYQKMAEKRLDPWDLAKIIGVEPSFVHGLLERDQRIDAVAASGLIIAFPNTNLTFWYSLDSLH